MVCVIAVVNVGDGKIDFVDGGLEGHGFELDEACLNALGQLNGFANVASRRHGQESIFF
jgi:hypothetical protein